MYLKNKKLHFECIKKFIKCLCVRLESDIKKLKADLQGSRNTEQELRSQVTGLSLGEKSSRSKIHQLEMEKENLETK